MSDFRVAIVRADGKTVRLRPGSTGERDFVEAIVAAAAAQGVGVFRTEAQVKKAIAAAVAVVFRSLKVEVDA